MSLVGKKAPIDLSQFSGKKVVLYFYPKDMTSGCTLESKDFQSALTDFEEANTVVIGVSPDDEKSHAKFKDKEGLTFELLADTEKELCQAFDVWKEKSMYGKKYIGVERSTFLIGDNGNVLQEWRNVKVPGHVSEVLAAAKLA